MSGERANTTNTHWSRYTHGMVKQWTRADARAQRDAGYFCWACGERLKPKEGVVRARTEARYPWGVYHRRCKETA